jgi:hypothetical protein
LPGIDGAGNELGQDLHAFNMVCRPIKTASTKPAAQIGQRPASAVLLREDCKAYW